MSDWIEIAQLSECPPGTALERVAGDRIVALYNVDGQLYALDGVCPHQGGPLGKGVLAGSVVTCPWHGWQFDVTSGCHSLNPRIVQPRLVVRVEGESILVKLPPAPA
jgi:nitrite reductase (NADH) small subunit